MNRLMTREHLRKENLVYRGTGGVSAGNRQLGFIPAFCDTVTGEVELSRLPNGNPAPMHLLESLPEKWIVRRLDANQVAAIKRTVIAGFLRAGVFYTRAQAARHVDGFLGSIGTGETPGGRAHDTERTRRRCCHRPCRSPGRGALPLLRRGSAPRRG